MKEYNFQKKNEIFSTLCCLALNFGEILPPPSPPPPSVFVQKYMVFYVTGHLAQDCFKTGGTSYELIPDLDDYMQSVAAPDDSSVNKKKKKVLNVCLCILCYQISERNSRLLQTYYC